MSVHQHLIAVAIVAFAGMLTSRRLRRRGRRRQGGGREIRRSADHMGRTDEGAEARAGEEDRLPVRRRTERHLASLRRLHQGGGAEARVERHHHRRQGQPDLLARRHEPGHRAEAGRHRPLRGRGEPAGPDQGRRRAGHQVRRPARRRAARAAARPQSLRQHPGGSARDRQGRGGLGDRRFQRQGARRRPQPQRICDRQGQIDGDQGRDREVPRLQGPRIRQLAGLRSGAAAAATDDELGAALRPADLRDLGRRQRLGLRRADLALGRRRSRARPS